MFGMDIRMVDWEEGGYRLGDQPRPRGELVIGGKSVSQGYFKVRLIEIMNLSTIFLFL